MRAIPFEPLDPGVYREIVRRALAEDFGWGDVTTETVIDRGQAGARDHTFEVVLRDCRPRQSRARPSATLIRGLPSRCGAKTATAASRRRSWPEYRGQASALLTAERTALNFLQRLSGIATLTRQFVQAADGRVIMLDTRKTTPLLRALEKYAVRAGGGVNHRGGLDEGILIKDNHVRLAGGVEQAVTRMRRGNREMPTEVEAQTLGQVDEALRAGRRDHPARQSLDARYCRSREALPRTGEDRDLRRGDADAHARAGGHRRRLHLHRRADALRAWRGSQFRH